MDYRALNRWTEAAWTVLLPGPGQWFQLTAAGHDQLLKNLTSPAAEVPRRSPVRQRDIT